MSSVEFRRGRLDYKRGITVNPYDPSSLRFWSQEWSKVWDHHRDWQAGWNDARDEERFAIPLDGTFEEYEEHYAKWFPRIEGDSQYVRAGINDWIGSEESGHLVVRMGERVKQRNAWMRHRGRRALEYKKAWDAFEAVYLACMEPTDEVICI